MADRVFEQSATSDLICIAPRVLDEIWPHVSALIEQAYAETDIPLPDVFGWLKAGNGLLWVASDDAKILGALTTSLEQKPSGLACRMVATAGEGIELWLGHLVEIEEYAKGAGCVKMILDGRRGWERVLPGYAVKAVSLEKRF